MKEVTVIVFESFDGKRFDSSAECREYEQGRVHLRLANLSSDQVQAALDRTDPDLADAFERAGLAIRNARRKAGEFKRAPPEKAVEPAPEREDA